MPPPLNENPKIKTRGKKKRVCSSDHEFVRRVSTHDADSDEHGHDRREPSESLHALYHCGLIRRPPLEARSTLKHLHLLVRRRKDVQPPCMSLHIRAVQKGMFLYLRAICFCDNPFVSLCVERVVKLKARPGAGSP